MNYYIVVAVDASDYECYSITSVYGSRDRDKCELKVLELQEQEKRKREARKEYWDWIKEANLNVKYAHESIGKNLMKVKISDLQKHPEFIALTKRNDAKRDAWHAEVNAKLEELSKKYNLTSGTSGIMDSNLEYEIEEVPTDDDI